MSNTFKVEDFAETYNGMSSQELTDLAVQGGKSLIPEAKIALKTALHERGIGENIIAAIDVQKTLYTEFEFLEYCDMLACLRCPICQRENGRLNATITAEVISIVLLTEYWTSLKIGCSSCLDKAIRKAIIKTAIFGWWGIPFGIIRTIQSLALNIKHQRHNHSPEPNLAFRDFVHRNIGVLDAYRDSPELAMKHLIRLNEL